MTWSLFDAEMQNRRGGDRQTQRGHEQDHCVTESPQYRWVGINQLHPEILEGCCAGLLELLQVTVQRFTLFLFADTAKGHHGSGHILHGIGEKF